MRQMHAVPSLLEHMPGKQGKAENPRERKKCSILVQIGDIFSRFAAHTHNRVQKDCLLI